MILRNYLKCICWYIEKLCRVIVIHWKTPLGNYPGDMRVGLGVPEVFSKLRLIGVTAGLGIRSLTGLSESYIPSLCIARLQKGTTELDEHTDGATCTQKQRVCQFSSLFLRERPRDVKGRWYGGGGLGRRRLVEKKHGTVAQWVFGDSCQVNVLDLSKLRSEKRHSPGRIEVLYRYTGDLSL